MPRPDRHDDDGDFDPPRRRRTRDEDDGEDDDAPPSDRRGRGGFPVWVPLSIVGGILGLLVIGGVVYFLARPDRTPPPDQPTADLAAAVDLDRGPRRQDMLFVPPAFLVDRVIRLRANASVNQLVFGGTDDGFVALVSYANRGPGHEIEVFKTATGDAKGTVRTKSSSGDDYALSPDGTYLAEINFVAFQGSVVAVYLVRDGSEANKFTPYPRTPQTLGEVPALTWIGFLPGNRLITVNEHGGYDVWTVPDFKKLHGQKGELTRGHSLRRDGFTHTTSNFALTPDGQTLALFDGTGFTFVNPTTGAETGRTDPFVARGASFNSWGCALRADGSRLAYLRIANRGNVLTVWDVKTGKPLSEVGTEFGGGAGFCWWGPDHILMQKGGIASADVVSVATGQVIGNVGFPAIGKLGPTGPGDCLWGYTEGLLIRSGPPGPIQPGTHFDVTPQGVQRR
jgi:hypothetical protein